MNSIKLSLLLAISVLLSPLMSNAQAGYIQRAAGQANSWGSTTGDGGLATDATFFRTGGVVKDGAGNLYISDVLDYRVRKVDGQTGIITTIVGNGTSSYTGDGGPASNATIGMAYNLAIDQAGNIFIPDRIAGVIRKVDGSTGIISTIANGLSQPFTVATDIFGNLYIPQGDEITKVDGVTGIKTTVAGGNSVGYTGDGGQATSAQINVNNSLTVDGTGCIYFCQDNHAIRKVDGNTGIITTIAGGQTAGFYGDGGQAVYAQFDNIRSLTVDAAGNIIIWDDGNGRIRKIDNQSGIINTIAGNGTYTSGPIDGQPALNVNINAHNIYADVYGNVYYTNYAGQVRYVTGDSTTSFTADSFNLYVSKNCSGATFVNTRPYYSVGMSIHTYFGDGSVDTSAIISGYNIGYAHTSHIYPNSGVYSVKQYLYDGTNYIDSLSFSYTHLFCSSMSVQMYNDGNSNCTYDVGTDYSTFLPMQVQVDSNNVSIDTLSCTSGFIYTAFGNVGDTYRFKIIDFPGDMVATCPVTGIVTDVLQQGVNATKYIGLDCNGGSNFDLRLFTDSRAGSHAFQTHIATENLYCASQNAVLTMHYNPAYTSFSATPPPTSQSTGTASWNINGLSASMLHAPIAVWLDGAQWATGTTVNTTYSITPSTGDMTPINNSVIIVDTVKGGFDPNAIYVTPSGCVTAGTKLEYKITFENMGNGPAENIYVLDTLPAALVPATLKLQYASHNMYVEKIYNGAQVILKFNFPHIMLPDSSDHVGRHGMLVYTIDTRPDLALGSHFGHRSGIYFDYNDPVMTNTAETGICFPTAITATATKGTSLIIYPNPATDELTIKTTDTYLSYTITNSIGQVMQEDALNMKETKLDIKALTTGVYYICLKGERGTDVRKFIKL